MITLLSLPNEVISTIADYTDPESKRNFALVNHQIREVVLDTIKRIRVFPPHRHSPDMPTDILVTAISRYPNLQKIIFGPSKQWTSHAAFGIDEAPYLKSFISYLQSNPEKHPLNSVKTIQFGEMMYDFFDRTQIRKLSSLFLSSLGHIGLKTIKIEAYSEESILTETEIQPVLEKSPHLRTFSFKGFHSDQCVTLTFTNQPHLSKVKLLYWKGDTSTIESLKTCEGLKELVISYRGVYSTKIRSILLEKHPWNLKRLELNAIVFDNDADIDSMTKKLPNLECLNVSLEGVSEEGMENLGKNCPFLKILRFSNSNITDAGLDKLTKRLPDLEVISLHGASDITEEGIAQGNCKKNHLTPKILSRYSGLQPASFLLLGTPNFSDVSTLSRFRAIFFPREKFSAA